MTDRTGIETSPPAPTAAPLRRQWSRPRAALIVLVVLALAVLAFPAGLIDWLDEWCRDETLCPPAFTALEGIERFSNTLRIAPTVADISDWARTALGIDSF